MLKLRHWRCRPVVFSPDSFWIKTILKQTNLCSLPVRIFLLPIYLARWTIGPVHIHIARWRCQLCHSLITVSRDGQHRPRPERNFRQDRLLPDPERRPADRLHHHTADHHIRRAHQPGLEERRGGQTGINIVMSCWEGEWMWSECFVQTENP